MQIFSLTSDLGYILGSQVYILLISLRKVSMCRPHIKPTSTWILYAKVSIMCLPGIILTSQWLYSRLMQENMWILIIFVTDWSIVCFSPSKEHHKCVITLRYGLVISLWEYLAYFQELTFIWNAQSWGSGSDLLGA